MNELRSVIDFSKENDLFRVRLKNECCRVAARRARELSEDELAFIAAAGDPAAQTQASKQEVPGEPEA